MEFILVIASFIAGYLAACWRVSRKTQVPFSKVVVLGGGPTDPAGPV